MARWRIDVSGVHALSAEVLTEGEAASSPVRSAESDLADAAGALSGVEGLGAAMSAVAEAWRGRGDEIATAISASVGAVTAGVTAYIDADGDMAQVNAANAAATSSWSTLAPAGEPR